MSQRWPTVSLGDVCQIDKRKFGSGDLPFVGLEDIASHSGEFLGSRAPRKVGSSTFEFGQKHVLYGRLRPYLNKVLVPDFSGHCSTEIFPLLPTDRLERRFLYYWLTRPETVEAINRMTTGARMPRADVRTLLSFQLNLPPLDEQRTIVAVLDEAFAGIALAEKNAEKNISNAQELFEAELDRLLSHPATDRVEQRLSELVHIAHGFAFDGADFEVSDDPSLPIVLTPGNYTEDAELIFAPRKTKRLTQGVVPQEYVFKPDELTVVMTDLSSRMKILGRPAFVECEGVLHNQRIGRVIPKSSTVPLRLVYYGMQTRRYLAHVRSTSTGTMVRHTAPSRITDALIFLPTVQAKQEQLVARLDELRSFVRRLKRERCIEIELLHELKDAILRRAFSGNLSAAGQAEAA